MSIFNKLIFQQAHNIIRSSPIIKRTPFELNERLSKQYNAEIFLKREDMQDVRSFKIRGAYHKIIKNADDITEVVTTSAGNHAQGVALTCNELKIKHTIFVPLSTPIQKLDKIKYFGKDYLNLKIVGETFDECLSYSMEYNNQSNGLFVHPFDDDDIILGQSSIADEIYERIYPDIIMCGVGGGGLISGIGSYSKLIHPPCKIIGIEPENANSMHRSLYSRQIEPVVNLDTFVDGASVKTVGNKCFHIGKKVIDKMYTVPNGKICNDIIDLYQNDGIIVEPAGVLGISGLEFNSDEIQGKKVVCIVTGGNNDISRYPDFIERSLLYNNLKHYFIVEFKQIPGQLQNYVNNVIQNNSIDITRFEYLKKTNKDIGTVLIGLELNSPNQLEIIIQNMKEQNYIYNYVNNNDILYSYII